MSASPPAHWPSAVLAFKEANWRAALEQSRGNITRAGAAIGISKKSAQRLTRQFGLTAFARELRVASGMPGAGRPRKANSAMSHVTDMDSAAQRRLK